MADTVPGFLADLELNGVSQSPITVQATLTRAKTELDKSVMDGSGESQSIPGKKSGTLTFAGYVAQAELAVLETAYALEVPVAFSLTVLEGLTVDSSYDGLISFNDFEVGVEVDGQWAFTAGGPLSGPTTFTPSTP